MTSRQLEREPAKHAELVASSCGLAASAFLTVTSSRRRGRARATSASSPASTRAARCNAITDVDGVRVGHTTIVEGDRVRTGVTAIVPHGGNVFQDKVAGAVFVGNAFGKLAGSTQVNELGTIETPIVLTNTLSVGTAMDAVVRYTLAQPGNEQVRSVNALVGETNDGGLNDIRGLHVTREHVLAAIAGATGGPVAEGTVGAGTGTVNYGWKGGIGTVVARSCPADSRRLHRRRARADQLRRQPDDRRRADLPQPAAAAHARRRGERQRRRVLHARRRDRRAARRARSAAARGARDLRPGAHRLVLQQRQRRLRDRLLDVAGDAQPLQRDRGRARTRSCRPTPRRRCSRPRSRRPRRRSTTRCSRRPRSARPSARPRRSRSTACASC